jgi:hypothetical protein
LSRWRRNQHGGKSGAGRPAWAADKNQRSYPQAGGWCYTQQCVTGCWRAVFKSDPGAAFGQHQTDEIGAGADLKSGEFAAFAGAKNDMRVAFGRPQAER